MPLIITSPWKVPQGNYCHPCAKACGLAADVFTSDLSQSQYQVVKIERHTTAPIPSRTPVSVFSSTDLQTYADYVVNTSAAGVVQIDAKGRRNIIWLFGKNTGYTYQHGAIRNPTDGMKLVLSSDPVKAHLMPCATSSLTIARCIKCDGPVLTPALGVPPLNYSV
jgi:hypothetical protein